MMCTKDVISIVAYVCTNNQCMYNERGIHKIMYASFVSFHATSTPDGTFL